VSGDLTSNQDGHQAKKIEKKGDEISIVHCCFSISQLKSTPRKPLNQIKPNLAGMVPFKILSDSPALHSRRLLLLKIEISSIVHCCFSISQNELKFNCSYMARCSLTYVPVFSVKFFFQPIYTNYAN
jgi:hypothetical protein